MRIRVIRKPVTACIDGIQLDRFEPGYEYDIDHRLGALFLAEGWAEPVALEPLAQPDIDPFSRPKSTNPVDPPNVQRQTYPYAFEPRRAAAADAVWKKRRKPRKR